VIAKITRGADAGGLARYLHGPGTHTVHEYRNDRGALIAGGKVIAGTVPVRHQGDGAGWARQFTHAGKARPKVVRNVWHCSLRCAPDDRTLSDREWSGIGQHLADRMGYGAHPWVMVRHDSDHVHIAVSRVGFDGAVWKGSNDRHIAVATMREVETTWQLTPVPAQQQEHGVKTRLRPDEVRKYTREHTVPVRTALAVTVHEARDLARGKGTDRFEAELDRLGVGWRKNVASTGRMNGYSFQSSGKDATGAPLWFPASKLDRALSWAQLSTELGGPVPPRRAKVSDLAPRGRFETARGYDRRRLAEGEKSFPHHRSWQRETTLARYTKQWKAMPEVDGKRAAANAAEETRIQDAARQAAEREKHDAMMRMVRASFPTPIREMLRLQAEREANPHTQSPDRGAAARRAREAGPTRDRDRGFGR